MKKQLLTLFATALTSIALSQTIPNGGFESWTISSYEDPQYFMCANDNSNNGLPPPINVVKTTDAYHGTYAIKLTTVLYNNNADTAGAYFADGNPGGNNGGQDGIPYNQKPTGVRFYYKCNIMPGDSALVLAIFKLGGNTIGQYLYHITGTQSSYTLFSQTFSPALTQTPDTVLFACASSNLMTKIGIAAGSMLQVDSVSFTGVASQPVNFGGDFEVWQTVSHDALNGWPNTNNPIQTTDKYSGTYALELMTTAPSFGNNQVQVGQVSNGVNHQSGPPTGGFPYSTQVDTLVFYYKYLPANYPLSTDSAQVNLSFTKNGSMVWGTGMRLPYSANYKKVVFPFSLSQAPDTVQISISSSYWPPSNTDIGSDLKIDQFYFKSQRVPVANFSLPATGCKGVPIQLTDNSTNMPTTWQWFMTGSNQGTSNLENPVVTYTSSSTPHTYTISLQAADSFGVSTFISKTITIYNNPVVSVTSATLCAGNTATLTASGASTYTWSTSTTGATYTVVPSSSTTFTVTGTDVNGCMNTATSNVIVPTTPTPSICVVTVDSIAAINNIIYWDKTQYNNVDSFIVYREVSTGIYSRIAGVSKDSLSMYIDVARLIGPANGDPNVGSYRYKLQIRDTCGNYGPMGPYHNTIFIIDNHTGSFSWNIYQIEGQANTPINNFYLLRDNNNTGNFINIGTVAGNQTSLTDPNYATYQMIANWRVQGDGFSCTPTFRSGNNSVASAIVKSKSNISNNRTTAIKNVNDNDWNIYPNPSNGLFTITLSVSKANADVYDLTGKKVASFVLQNSTTQIDLSNLNSGSYFIEINTANGILHKKINKIN